MESGGTLGGRGGSMAVSDAVVDQALCLLVVATLALVRAGLSLSAWAPAGAGAAGGSVMVSAGEGGALDGDVSVIVDGSGTSSSGGSVNVAVIRSQRGSRRSYFMTAGASAALTVDEPILLGRQ